MVKLITNKSFLSIQDRKRHRRVVNNSGHKSFRKAKTLKYKPHKQKKIWNKYYKFKNIELRKVKATEMAV